MEGTLIATTLINTILKRVRKNPLFIDCDNLFQAIRNYEEVDFDEAHELMRELREISAKQAVNRKLKVVDREKFYNLYRMTLLFASPHDFDSYLLYMEFNRQPKKRFYLPRRHVLKPLVDDYQDLLDGKIEFLGISLPPRVGKLVADYEPVLTKEGWKNHGDLGIGDVVYNHKGEEVKVTHVFPKNFANKRVTFSNGDKVDVHENHEWLVHNRHKGRMDVVETKDIQKDLFIHEKDKRRFTYQLPLKTPIAGEEKELPVKPYTFGAWLGDGRTSNPDICGDKNDYPIVEAILEEGYEISWQSTHKTTDVEYYGFKTLRADLQKIGLCHSRKSFEKYIPDEYLTASLSQRLELLAGLLDTDGSYAKSENRYQFTTASEKLRDSFVELISTFGWRASVVKKEPRLSTSGIQGKKPYWVIGFNPTLFIPCRLTRKQPVNFSKQRKISIINVEDIEETPGNCISVEGEIYLVGKTMQPTHNSTLGVFFITMLMGKYPDEANVMSGHSDKLTRGFYDEALSIVTDEQYNWKDIFPGHEFVTSAKDETIDLDKKRRFSTLTCRAIGATLTGAVEVKRCLYSDDLVSDLEEALNPQRMQNKYDAYLNTLKDRKLDGAMEVMVGTRWGVDDPLGRIQEQYADDPRYRFTVIPALNEKGESNFVYKYGVGFSTEYYMDMKASIDDATWQAKYMGNPYVREGLLFPEDSLRTYNGELPADIDKVVSVVDVAWGGGDYFTQIFAYISGDAIYIHDVICDKGDKTVTRPRSVAKLKAHTPTQTQYEANNGGDEYADNVDRELREIGIKLNISSKKAPNNKSKMGRIIEYQPEIRDFYFRDTNHRDQDYKEFMNMMTRYSLSGKNANDDAPDACAMLAELVRGHNNKFKVFKRTW